MQYTVCIYFPTYLTNPFRFTSHKNEEFKVDCCLNNFDTHIICGSEDGNVYIWDLLKVKYFGHLLYLLIIFAFLD